MVHNGSTKSLDVFRGLLTARTCTSIHQWQQAMCCIAACSHILQPVGKALLVLQSHLPGHCLLGQYLRAILKIAKGDGKPGLRG